MRLRQRLPLIPLVLAVALAAGACTVPSPAPSEKTIAQQLLSDTGDNAAGFDDDWYDFDIATQAILLYPDLVEAASDPSASLTVFLPNDRAFQVLVYSLTGNVVLDEQGVFDAVAFRDRKSGKRYSLRDLDPNADDAGVVYSKFNYGGSLANGYIHGLSLVLRPADL